MKKYYTLLFFTFFSSFLAAQNVKPLPGNIVPNHSFERFSTVPLGWFYKGEHYTRLMKYWVSPTGASPDVFGQKVKVPKDWYEKDFGKLPPRSGGAMTGMTVYGCEGKPHCREYVQIQLVEPLVLGQTYYCEMWVAHLPRSLQINNLGFHFSEKEIDEKIRVQLEQEPQINAEEIIDAARGKWQKISGTFIAKTEAEFLTIGNFFDDANTKMRPQKDDHLPYAYYYVDDILVKKVPPILPVPIKEDDLTLIELEEGQTIELKDIYFDFDSAELHPRSYIELKKLLYLMQQNKGMRIEILGHTDDVGEDKYNKYLSRKRAKSVVLYLMENAVAPSRLEYSGKGEGLPIASNETEEGRQLNRRVEFRILKK